MSSVVVDLRSDTLTKPTPEMRQAMKDAEVGDDVFREDPTVQKLEGMCAELFGMESAVFVPTGTMGNLSAVMSHCNLRGQELLVGDKSHIFLNEQGGVSQLAGVHSWAVPTQPNGILELEDLTSRIRHKNLHCPQTALITVENTHNYCAGAVLPTDYLEKVYGLGKQHGIPVHVDGARIYNAATYLDVPISQILRGSSSVMMCLSKGLACPAGSLVGGSKEFTERILRARKALGGGMRQSGVLAAAGIVALNTTMKRLFEDHEHAQMLASALQGQKESDLFTFDPNLVKTNMVMIDFPTGKFSPLKFCQRLQEVPIEEVEELEDSIVVKMIPITSVRARAVFHNDISTDQTKLAIKKIKYVLEKLTKY